MNSLPISVDRLVEPMLQSEAGIRASVTPVK